MILLDQFPVWAVYLGTMVAVLLAAETGFRLGHWQGAISQAMQRRILERKGRDLV